MSCLCNHRPIKSDAREPQDCLDDVAACGLCETPWGWREPEVLHATRPERIVRVPKVEMMQAWKELGATGFWRWLRGRLA